MRVAIYTRISRDSHADNSGVLRQEQLCRQYAEARGWKVVGVYCDNDVSASSYGPVRRPAFERLLKDLAGTQFERVVVLAQDRLVRRPEQLEDILRVLSTVNDLGVECVLGGPLDALSSTGRIQARVKVVFDAAYADFISERISLKKRELASRGLPPGGGARPFGYMRDGVTLNVAEAQRIQEAADRVIAGESLYSICEDWDRRGVPSAQNRRWRSGVLRKMLEAPRIAGLRAYRGEIVGAAAWPAILDERTYASVRACFADSDRRHGGRPAMQTHLLSGIACCGRCRRTLLSNVVKGARYYVCRKTPTRGCGRLGMKAEPLEKYVVSAVFEAVDNYSLSRTRVESLQDARQRLEGARISLDHLCIRYFVRCDLTIREYEAARRALLARIHELEAEVALDEDALGEEVTITQRWGTLNPDQQREFLRKHIVELVIAPAVRGRSRIDLARVHLEARG